MSSPKCWLQARGSATSPGSTHANAGANASQETNGNTASGEKGKSKGGGKGKRKSPKTTTASPQAEAGEKKEEGQSTPAQVKSVTTTEEPAQPAQVATPTTPDPNQQSSAQMMNEVTSLLKSLRVESQAQIKSTHMCRLVGDQETTALLDGGATHVLRKVVDDEEWSQSQDVSVRLATGTVTLRQHPLTGSLLTQQACQPIIPMASWVKLGYQVQWGEISVELCLLHNRATSQVRSKMSNGRLQNRDAVAPSSRDRQCHSIQEKVVCDVVASEL